MKTIEEHWKPIPGYEKYYASTFGNIKSPNGILKPSILIYSRVSLSLNGKTKSFLVHRLIALAHFGPPPNGMVVCHLDGNARNNRAENLKYASNKENHAHKVIHGTQPFGEKCISSKLTAKDVLEIRMKYKKTGRFMSNARKLAHEYGITYGNVWCIIKRKSWKNLENADIRLGILPGGEGQGK